MSLRDTLLLGEALATLKSIPDNTYDSIVTDPPYGMSDHEASDIIQALSAWIMGEIYTPRMKGGMMGRGWDAFVPGPELWKECYRVLKPGGHILAASSTRTQDLLGIALRLAGFECRDTIVWIKSGGFPKSVNIAKVVEAHLEHGRSDSTVTGDGARDREDLHWSEFPKSRKKTQPKTIEREEAKRYEGHGTALKPSHEPFLMFRKPLIGTVAENVLKHGTGGINIDGCRIPVGANEPDSGAMYYRNRGQEMPENQQSYFGAEGDRKVQCNPTPGGRWPGNVVLSHLPGCRKIGTRKVKTGTTYEPDGGRKHTLYGGGIDSLGRTCGYGGEDGTETIPAWDCEDGCPVDALDEQSGTTSITGRRSKQSSEADVRNTVWGPRNHRSVEYPMDSGGASRFFLCTDGFDEWGCEPGCPVDALNKQGGISKGGTSVRSNGVSQGGYTGKSLGTFPEGSQNAGYKDEGYVSRFFLCTEGEWECETGCPVSELDEQSGLLKSGELKQGGSRGDPGIFGGLRGEQATQTYEPNEGGASRFFFCAKASKKERTADGRVINKHISVKPLKLMRYLCRLVTPPGGHILDPFMGSGSTGVAAIQEGFQFTGIEMEPESHQTAVARILLADNPLLWDEDLKAGEPKDEETKDESPQSLTDLLGLV